jgi:hypothetical protein
MAQAGTAWTPTLCAVLGVPGTAPQAARQRAAEHRRRLPELLPLAHRLGVPILAGAASCCRFLGRATTMVPAS